MPADKKVREPWPGYADLGADEREAELAKKFDDAKQHGDKSHAMALTAAVANYELVQELQDGSEPEPSVAEKAHGLHDDAGSWIGS